MCLFTPPAFAGYSFQPATEGGLRLVCLGVWFCAEVVYQSKDDLWHWAASSNQPMHFTSLYLLIVSVFIVMLVLFYIHLFSYFHCKYVIKRSVQVTGPSVEQPKYVDQVQRGTTTLNWQPVTIHIAC